MKETLLQRLANLLSVKSLVTLMLTVTVCSLTIAGKDISSIDRIFTTIIGFYFAYQSTKDGAA